MTVDGRRWIKRTCVIELFPEHEEHDPEAQDDEDEEDELLLLVGEPFLVPLHLVINQVACRLLHRGDKLAIRRADGPMPMTAAHLNSVRSLLIWPSHCMKFWRETFNSWSAAWLAACAFICWSFWLEML